MTRGIAETLVPKSRGPSLDQPANVETSGGTRYSHGKPGGFWYLPMLGLRMITRVAQFGAKKYAPYDWAEGQSFSVLFDCLFRHTLAVQADGIWSTDQDSGELHLAHAGWNLLCMLHFMEQGRTDLDDITPWRGVTAAKKRQMETEKLPQGGILNG